MLKALPFLGLMAVAGHSIASAEDAEDSATFVHAVEAATTCVLSANKGGAETKLFDEDTKWKRQEDGSYSAEGSAVRVTFPLDPDGVARICVVEATLTSQKQQTEMQTVFEVLLKQKPIQQEGSLIWMFGSPPEVRGLQFFHDKKSEQPQVRLIGAAF